jgi:hypothetical protein
MSTPNFQITIRDNIFKSKLLEEEEMCNECNTTTIIHTCNKCGNGVCSSPICGWIFPHKYQTNYIICNSCAETINQKLIVLIDYGKLSLLKRKINVKIEKQIQTINQKELEKNQRRMGPYGGIIL